MAQCRGFYCDDETGETRFYNINEETGEATMNAQPPIYPSHGHGYTPPTTAEEFKTTFPKCYKAKTKKFQMLKEKIITGSNTTSHRLLLIPTTVMIFPGFLCILLMMLEVFLHVRCHKKNKNLKDSNVYYCSPFHMVTSAFCGVCKDHDSASVVGQLQDKRKDRYDYLRGIAL